MVVAAKELVHPRCVARAAGVFEQKRVEQIGLLRLWQTDDLSEPHTDDAAPRAVTLGVAFGESRAHERAVRTRARRSVPVGTGPDRPLAGSDAMTP